MSDRYSPWQPFPAWLVFQGCSAAGAGTRAGCGAFRGVGRSEPWQMARLPQHWATLSTCTLCAGRGATAWFKELVSGFMLSIKTGVRPAPSRSSLKQGGIGGSHPLPSLKRFFLLLIVTLLSGGFWQSSSLVIKPKLFQLSRVFEQQSWDDWSCKREREREANSCKFANFCHVASEGMGGLLIEVLVWSEVNSLFKVLLYWNATWQVQQLAHSYWRNHLVVESHCKLQVWQTVQLRSSWKMLCFTRYKVLPGLNSSIE